MRVSKKTGHENPEFSKTHRRRRRCRISVPAVGQVFVTPSGWFRDIVGLDSIPGAERLGASALVGDPLHGRGVADHRIEKRAAPVP
jgi:hypothetical protein